MIFSASISIPESIRSAKSMHSSPSTWPILKGLLRVNRKLCRATFWAEIVILPGLFSAFGPFLRFRIRSRLVVLISSFCRLNVPPLIVTLSKTSLLSKSSQIFRVASARFTYSSVSLWWKFCLRESSSGLSSVERMEMLSMEIEKTNQQQSVNSILVTDEGEKQNIITTISDNIFSIYDLLNWIDPELEKFFDGLDNVRNKINQINNI